MRRSGTSAGTSLTASPLYQHLDPCALPDLRVVPQTSPSSASMAWHERQIREARDASVMLALTGRARVSLAKAVESPDPPLPLDRCYDVSVGLYSVSWPRGAKRAGPQSEVASPPTIKNSRPRVRMSSSRAQTIIKTPAGPSVRVADIAIPRDSPQTPDGDDILECSPEKAPPSLVGPRDRIQASPRSGTLLSDKREKCTLDPLPRLSAVRRSPSRHWSIIFGPCSSPPCSAIERTLKRQGPSRCNVRQGTAAGV